MIIAKIEGEQIPAEALRDVCTSGEDVTLFGLTIVGRLDLSGSHLRNSLQFMNCVFEDRIDLSDARAEEPVGWHGGTIAALVGNRFESKADVSLSDVAVGAIALHWAHIQGDVRFSNSKIRVPHGLCLDCRDLRVDGSLFLDGASFRAEGEACLSSAHIKQSLDCRHATFHNPEGKALNAYDLTVDGDIMCEAGFTAEGEVCLERVTVSRLQLGGGTFRNDSGRFALRADSLCARAGVFLDNGFHAFGGVRMVGADITGQLCCTQGIFHHPSGIALDARRLKAGDVYLDRGFVAKGQVRLDGALLTRQLNCTAGEFDDGDGAGRALDCDGLECDGDIFLDRGFSAKGEARLVGARVSHELNCTGGHFENPGGTALNADGFTTPGNVFLDSESGTKFQAIGEVRLARATIGRQLVLSGARLTTNPNTLSLDLTGIVCPGDILLNNGFRTTGILRLQGANITRDLDFTGSELLGVPNALEANSLQVGGSVKWEPSTTPRGAVDLSAAVINKLDDSLTRWPIKNYVLAGFTCQNPPIADGKSAGQLISWLENSKAHYSDAYQQMGLACRTKGFDHAVRDIAIARQRDLRKRGHLQKSGRLWNWLLDISSGYGYKLHRPLLLLAGMAILGALIFTWADTKNLMFGTNGPESVPFFQPLVYSIQLLIPGMNLQQVPVWLPKPHTAEEPWLMAYIWVSIVIGWVLSGALLAGLGRLWRQGDR